MLVRMSSWSDYSSYDESASSIMANPNQFAQPKMNPMAPQKQGAGFNQVFSGGGNTLPTQPANIQAPPTQYTAESSNVPLPPSPPASINPSKFPDVSDHYEVSDWVYIGIAVLLVDVLVLFLIRFFPDFFGKTINVWYNRFKLSAVLADVLIIMIGFGIARYIYTEYIYPNYDWNPAYFTGLAVVVQIIHDVLFYFGVIKTVPRGQNAMMDVFKDYAESGGAKVVAADSAMMIGSSFFSMALKAMPAPWIPLVGLLVAYTVPFILETKNEFSGMS
jgi:hypothetical protein